MVQILSWEQHPIWYLKKSIYFPQILHPSRLLVCLFILPLRNIWLQMPWISITSHKHLSEACSWAAKIYVYFQWGVINLDLCGIICFTRTGRKFPKWHKFLCPVSCARHTDSWCWSNVYKGLQMAFSCTLTQLNHQGHQLLGIKLPVAGDSLQSTRAINNLKFQCWAPVPSVLLLIDWS